MGVMLSYCSRGVTSPHSGLSQKKGAVSVSDMLGQDKEIDAYYVIDHTNAYRPPFHSKVLSTGRIFLLISTSLLLDIVIKHLSDFSFSTLVVISRISVIRKSDDPI